MHKCVKDVIRKTIFKGCTSEEERPGTQFLALKVFDRQSLRQGFVQIMDSQTGLCRLSNNLEAVTKEINIWKRVNGAKQDGSRNYNVVKIFELFDDDAESKMFLLMEYCKYGQIQHSELETS